jgi:polysaccharide export outer membrane protein
MERLFTLLTNFDEVRTRGFHFPRFPEIRTLRLPPRSGRVPGSRGSAEFDGRLGQHMHASSTTSAIRIRSLMAAGILALTAFTETSPALSDPLAPQTKLRVTVIQWMPTKGMYELWNALGGEFVVSQSGNVVLPVIGSVPVGNLDGAGLAAEIANRLQEKLVLVDKPDTTVEIVDYPPVYVVGDVTNPGEYRYREGMTVLQALALSGGERRSSEARSEEEIQMVGALQKLDSDIIRSMARIARLDAEMTGAKEIRFPTVSADDLTAKEVFARERIIFTARANELERQTKSLAELHDLLNAEINVLQEKIKATEASIKAAETELTGVTSLVERGIAVASRKSDLERTLAGYRTDRLDQITATMRARQAITEATRNADGLRDRQQTEIATSLQEEEANLDNLKRNRDISQKLLLKLLGSRSITVQGEAAPTFTITRTRDGSPSKISASDATILMPGDVISVASAMATSTDAGNSAAATGMISTTGLSPDEAGQ